MHIRSNIFRKKHGLTHFMMTLILHTGYHFDCHLYKNNAFKFHSGRLSMAQNIQA